MRIFGHFHFLAKYFKNRYISSENTFFCLSMRQSYTYRKRSHYKITKIISIAKMEKNLYNEKDYL